MFKYDMYKDKHKQQETQTRILTRTNTEDRRQGHLKSLEPIAVGPWCMHTNSGLTIRHKTQHRLQHIIYNLEAIRQWFNKFTWRVAFQAFRFPCPGIIYIVNIFDSIMLIL